MAAPCICIRCCIRNKTSFCDKKRKGGLCMKDTRQLTRMGLLLALAIALKGIAVYIPVLGVLGIRIGFMSVIVAATGALYGPAAGGIFGAVYDLLAFMVFPTGGPYFPGFTISFALVGIMGGVFLHGRIKKKMSIGYKWCGVLFVVIAVLIDLMLNTLWLSMLTGKAFMFLLAPRIIAKVVTMPINAYILMILLDLSARYELHRA